MTVPFHIQPAVIADYDQLCATWEIGDALHRDAVPYMFRVSDQPPKSRGDVEALIAGPLSTILVAVSGANILGLMTLLEKRVTPNAIAAERRYVEVDNMVVMPSVQRQGIGSAFLQAAADWAQARGISSLELSVYDFNDGAQALYRGAGFAPVLTRMRRKISD
jgi:ribosomal protein S18 acetylase RimI-like enzyme